MSTVRELLEQAVEDDEFVPPGPSLYAVAARRRRRALGARIAGGGAVATLVAGGVGLTGAGMMPFFGGSTTMAAASGSGSTGSMPELPSCVQAQLRTLNTNVKRYGQSAVVVDIPATKVPLVDGISAGTGWDGVRTVQVLRPNPGMTPPTTFKLWDGVTPDTDLAPGRHLVTVFLDASPKVPGGTYGEPVWGFNVTNFPVSGDSVVVTCANGTQVALKLDLAATTWLAPDAPIDPPPTVPAGGSTPWSPGASPA